MAEEEVEEGMGPAEEEEEGRLRRLASAVGIGSAAWVEGLG